MLLVILVEILLFIMLGAQIQNPLLNRKILNSNTLILFGIFSGYHVNKKEKVSFQFQEMVKSLSGHSEKDLNTPN